MDKDKVKGKYQNIETQELIIIVHNINDDYEDEAVELALEELKTRGVIKIPKPVKPDEEDTEEAVSLPTDPELISRVIRIYGDERLAEQACSRLRAEDIESFIWKDDCGSARPWLQMYTGVRLAVREDDAEAAEKILDRIEADKPKYRQH